MNSLEIIKQAYIYLNEKDIPSYFSLMSPNVEFYQTEELPWGGYYRGLNQSKVFFSKFSPLIDSSVETSYYIQAGDLIDSSVEISHYIQAGEQTVAIGKISGSAKLTRKKFCCNLAHIWTVKKEEIVRLEVYIDTNAMNAALV